MSDTDDKGPKIYKNPARNTEEKYVAYIPQYSLRGKEPKLYQSNKVMSSGSSNPATRTTTPPLTDGVRNRPKGFNLQSYGDPSLQKMQGAPPNVGNNMDHSWSSIDGEIIDDLNQQLNPDHVMIDNNDIVTDEALGFQNGITAQDIRPNYQSFPPMALEKEVSVEHHPVDTNDVISVITDLDHDSYLLLVSGVAICSGPKEEIEDQAAALVYGEHEICEGNPVPIDDIIIIKRVKIKVGLFLE